MTKPKVFVTREIPDKGLDLVKEFCDADIWPHEIPPARAELVARVRDVDGLLSMLTEKVDAELMDAAPRLKVISNFAVGVDNVDVPAATARKIPVGNTPGVLTDATADMAFALLMSAARRVTEGERYVRAGKWKTWSPQFLLGADFAGATLGIIGFGRIGQAVAKRAQGFDLRVIYFDPSSQPAFGATPVDLDALLHESDFISLHVPLTEETRHMINAGALSKMKPNAVLVNTARGPVVDPQALYAALKSKQIFAAALDVTEPEPLPVDSPLLELDNCIIIPHLGSASKHTRDMMSLLAAQNLIAGLKGEQLPNCVNKKVYY
ncbi:MAG: D-glycerate dehydrogenase [Chloroflexi bacterium]|nr:D-glycerate dehydrogenase [Chloroflexota bacterium]MBI3339468.1 D-glycerate dehydrogenase [Chloroflexota bacterium]